MPSFLPFSAALPLLSCIHGSFARHDGFRHGAAADASKRQSPGDFFEPLLVNYTVTAECAGPTPVQPLTVIIPSPDAAPVTVTAQSQVVTSYVPEATWCVGPPIAIFALDRPPYLNTTSNATVEYSTSIGGPVSCETVYVSTATTVCATTLTGIASKITVSECDQEITFSTECGFALETPTPTSSNYALITPAPTIRSMLTYYLAPWQSLTAGENPRDVDKKVCTVLDSGDLECVRDREIWEVVLVTETVTLQSQVQLTTTVSGPGTLIVETMQVQITDAIETINLTTTLLIGQEIETESTSKRALATTTGGYGNGVDTQYITKKVKYRTSRFEPRTTIRVTSTVTHVGTVTRTRSRPRPRQTLLDMVVDF